MQTRHGADRLPAQSRGSAHLLEKSLTVKHPPGGISPVHIQIRCAADVLSARKAGRSLALVLGFNEAEVTSIVTSISEVARNIVEYAYGGEVIIKRVHRGARYGLEIVALDSGPGIRNPQTVMEPGYSGSPGAGMGLTRAKWLMDTFKINSKIGRGTTVTMVKWRS